MGGGTSSYREIEETDCILLWGSNARETHPIFFHHLLKGVKRGAKLYAIDPRRTTSAQWADVWAGLDVGTDIALSNTMAREIIAEQPDQPRLHRSRDHRFRGVSRAGRAVDAGERRDRNRRARGRDPRDGAHLRHLEARDHLLDARHHRASHRRAQRAGADQPGAPDRPCRASGDRDSIRCAARTTSRAAATWARCPIDCPGSSTSRTTRCARSSIASTA